MDSFQRGALSVSKHIQSLIWHYQLMQLVTLLCSFITSSAVSYKLLKNTFWQSSRGLFLFASISSPRILHYQSIKKTQTIQSNAKIASQKKKKSRWIESYSGKRLLLVHPLTSKCDSANWLVLSCTWKQKPWGEQIQCHQRFRQVGDLTLVKRVECSTYTW